MPYVRDIVKRIASDPVGAAREALEAVRKLRLAAEEDRSHCDTMELFDRELLLDALREDVVELEAVKRRRKSLGETHREAVDARNLLRAAASKEKAAEEALRRAEEEAARPKPTEGDKVLEFRR